MTEIKVNDINKISAVRMGSMDSENLHIIVNYLDNNKTYQIASGQYNVCGNWAHLEVNELILDDNEKPFAEVDWSGLESKYNDGAEYILQDWIEDRKIRLS